MPSYFSWVAAAAAAVDSQIQKMTWPPAPIPGRPIEPCGFDGLDMIPVLFGRPGGDGGGGASPRTEVVHAVINAHNPPHWPDGPMKAEGYPYSCKASSFCGGAIRIGNYKLFILSGPRRAQLRIY